MQITYHFFHWKKGTPFADDQGINNSLTWLEQIENDKQLTFIIIIDTDLKF